MRTRKAWFTLLAGLLVAAGSSPSWALTDAEAIQRAKDFLAVLRLSIPPDATASVQPDKDWAGVHVVRFRGDFFVRIRDSDGRPVGLFNGSACLDAPVQNPITEEQARQAAEAHLEAVGGLPEGAVFANVAPTVGCPNGAPCGPISYGVVWYRYEDKCRYIDDDVTVIVRPDDGGLISYENRFHTPSPPSLEPGITLDAAVQTAQQAIGDPNAGPEKTELVAVDLDRWSGQPPPWGRRRGLAWLILFDQSRSVMVDAQSGEVLSVGGPFGSAASGPEAPPAIPGYCGDAPAAPEGVCPDVFAVLQKGCDVTVTFRTTSFPARQRTATASLTEDLASQLVKCVGGCAGLSPDGPPRNGDTFALSLRKNGEPPAELVWWKAVAGEGFLYGTHEREPHAFCRWSTSDEFGNILERLVSDVPFKPWRYWEEEK